MRRLFILFVLTVFAAGCGVKAQTYVMSKERLDIESTDGNSGFISGQGKEYQEPEKKTRRVYILELTKPVPESQVKKIQQEVTMQTSDVKAVESGDEPIEEDSEPIVEQPTRATVRPIVLPSFEDEHASQPAEVLVDESGPKEVVMYTVLKDDTLQKIAKKFYNSYGKWTKIYDANKDKIKNPNFVKPGTVIVIPAVN